MEHTPSWGLAYLDKERELPKPAQESGGKARGGAVVRRLERRSEARRPEDVRAQPITGDGALTRAVDIANKNPVSLSALVEKYGHHTTLSDAARLLDQ